MNHQINTDDTTELAHGRREYAQPLLTMLGDIRTLTETGSMTGNEDNIHPNCAHTSTGHNNNQFMC